MSMPSTMDMDAYNNATFQSSGTHWMSWKMVVGVLTGDVNGNWIGQCSVLTAWCLTEP